MSANPSAEQEEGGESNAFWGKFYSCNEEGHFRRQLPKATEAEREEGSPKATGPLRRFQSSEEGTKKKGKQSRSSKQFKRIDHRISQIGSMLEKLGIEVEGADEDKDSKSSGN